MMGTPPIATSNLNTPLKPPGSAPNAQPSPPPDDPQQNTLHEECIATV